jgi:hypothetical protein
MAVAPLIGFPPIIAAPRSILPIDSEYDIYSPHEFEFA